MWHFQVTGAWKVSWTYNDYHKGLKHGWFAWYKFEPLKNARYYSRDCAVEKKP